MDFHVLTLFPEMILQGLGTSITGRAIDKGLISVNAVNIRDFSEDKHNRVDDYPYGGGAGMVMQAEPVFKSYGYLVNHIKMAKESSVEYRKPRVIYVTPQGSIFNQTMAEEFAKEEDLIILCGHYEGIDERVLEMIVTDNVSIGDYVLTGGELPAMVMIDAISRLIPGVLSNDVSSEFESLHDNLLEYPKYTRPETFMGQKVPEVLLSGHHANIDAWRRRQSILRTYERRPDLLADAQLTEEEREYLTRLIFQKNYEIY
ncbi:MAG: tRNA (guanosine(37)-N1)-methyltransferase TrmD [Mobilitalea sp.]